MMLTTEDILQVIKKNLTKESQWLLFALSVENHGISKEQLWKKTNELFHNQNSSDTDHSSYDPDSDLITSRYVLDIHTARLEGAGLVDLNIFGRTRVYSLSAFGREFLTYVKSKSK